MGLTTGKNAQDLVVFTKLPKTSVNLMRVTTAPDVQLVEEILLLPAIVEIARFVIVQQLNHASNVQDAAMRTISTPGRIV
jgi:hypothetical protein